jgi:hypothetical protein
MVQSLPSGEIIAPTVGEILRRYRTTTSRTSSGFLNVGGLRGRQYQVLVDGTYYINRLFATVELISKTVVPVGYVGVVVSYVGKQGEDISGEAYRHGELVGRGYRGVWYEPLLPASMHSTPTPDR